MDKRTSCSCDKCQHGCKVMPAYLLPEDLAPYPWMYQGELLASEGGLVGIVNKLTGEMTKFRVPTLVPASKDDGSCVHYRDGKCGIHEDKLAEEFQMRLLQMWSNFTRGEASAVEEMYCRQWQILWDEGKRRENVQDITNKYQEGII